MLPAKLSQELTNKKMSDNNFQLLDIKDYSTNETLHQVINRCITLRPSYWENKIPKKSNLLIVVFKKAEDQFRVLKPIVKIINKGMVPTDEQLNDLLCICEMGSYESFISHRRSKGHFDNVSNMEKLYKDNKGKKRMFFVYTSSSLDALEDRIQFSLHGFDNDPNPIIEQLKSDSPDLTEYLMAQDVSDFKRDVEMEKSILSSMNRKICATCKKEPADNKCGVCGVVYYCDRECQKNDWKVHKTMCKTLRSIKTILFQSMEEGM